MEQPGSPVYIALSADNMTKGRIAELNSALEQFSRELRNETDKVDRVAVVSQSEVPEGAKVALELTLAGQVLLQVVPIVVPWLLGQVDTFIKSRAASGTRVKAKVLSRNRQVQITPETTKSELASYKQDFTSLQSLGAGRRLALVIGNSKYDDSSLPSLNSPEQDARRLAAVLSDVKIGAFNDVKVLIDQTNDVVKRAMNQFFTGNQPEDLMLLYFSGHGVRPDGKQFFLAARDTMLSVLKATGIAASYVTDVMNDSESRRKILILDCCHGAAVVPGAKADLAVGRSIHSVDAFAGQGSGQVIIAGSEATQYAIDGQNVKGHIENSVFTSQLITGLQSGAADADGDGLVEVGELYQYAYDRAASKQTPNISIEKQAGKLFIGVNPSGSTKSVPLSDDLQKAITSGDKIQKLGAVTILAGKLNNGEPGEARAAKLALERLAKTDDLYPVREAAQAALNAYEHANAPSQPQPVPPVKSPRQPVPAPAPPAPYQVPPAPPATNPPAKGMSAKTFLILLGILAGSLFCCVVAYYASN